MSRNKKIAVIIPSVCAGLALIILLGLILTGLYVGWGPFTYLQFDSQERAIVEKYDAKERKGEIVFYGASNFRLWTEMENDLAAILCLLVGIINYFFTTIASYISSSGIGGAIQELLEKLSLFERFYSFPNGVFDISNLIFLAVVAVVFVFFTVQSMEKRRWS